MQSKGEGGREKVINFGSELWIEAVDSFGKRKARLSKANNNNLGQFKNLKTQHFLNKFHCDF